MSREIDLIGGFYRDEPWSAQDTVNWLPVPAQAEGTRSPMKLRGVPGLKPLGDTTPPEPPPPRGMLAMYAGSGSGARAAISFLEPETGGVVEEALINCPLDYRSRSPVRIGGKIYALLENSSGNFLFFDDAFKKLYAEDMTSMSFPVRVVTPCTNATEVAGIDRVTQRSLLFFDIVDITVQTRQFPITENGAADYYCNAINETQAIVGGFDDGIYRARVFDIETGTLLHEKTFGNDTINAVAISDTYFAVLFYLTGTTEGDTIRVYSLATGDMTAELTIPGFIRTAMFMNDDYIGIGVDDAGNSVEIYALGAGASSISFDKTVDAFAAQKTELGLATLPGFPYASAG